MGQLLGHLDEKGWPTTRSSFSWPTTAGSRTPTARATRPSRKQSPYDGGLRTPILLRWPGRVQPRKSEALAMSIDIVPTLLAVARLNSRPRAMQGVNLLDAAARRAAQGDFRRMLHAQRRRSRPAGGQSPLALDDRGRVEADGAASPRTSPTPRSSCIT